MTRSGRFVFTSIWVVALLPVVAAATLYFGRIAVPEGRINSGELIAPGTRLEDWPIVSGHGQRWRGTGRWQLLLMQDGCREECRLWLEQLHLIKQALGRDRERLEHHLVIHASEIETDDPALTFDREEGMGVDQGIYLADPLGNLVLRYGLKHSPRDLLRDLRRLLKASKVG